jgi:dTDP-4-dehydrorhamnose reductase
VPAERQILVLGASGMLGSAVRRILESRPGWSVDGTQNGNPEAADYLDLVEMPRERWTGMLQRKPYDYIVNCIGILKPAVRENDAASLARGIRVNALFPHELAALAPGSRILHLSTDGVFSGTVDRPLVETDPTDCPDSYGKTKALGECPAPNVLNFRCSIIGLDPLQGKGLIEWVLRSPRGAELTGFEDQRWNGVTTRQFGELCRRIVEGGWFDRIRKESGTHHFCPNPPTNKYELLGRIRTVAGRDDLFIRAGRSGVPGSRILASVYTSLRELYPPEQDWGAVLRDAVSARQRHYV